MASKPSSNPGSSQPGTPQTKRCSLSLDQPVARTTIASQHFTSSDLQRPVPGLGQSTDSHIEAELKFFNSTNSAASSPLQGAPDLHNYEIHTYNSNKQQPCRSLPRSTSFSTNRGLRAHAAVDLNDTISSQSSVYLDSFSFNDPGALAQLSLRDPYRLHHSHLEEPDTMDEAFRQHASPSRRKNLSFTNLSHLSLAPVTSRMPFSDDEQNIDAQYSDTPRSYLEGKSTPTTPGLLARGPAHYPPRAPLHPSAAATASLPIRSLSATALHSMTLQPRSHRGGSGAVTPTRHHHHRLAMTAADPPSAPSVTDRDWLEHTGALLSDSAREYKGQSWLVSRESSTSLTGYSRAEGPMWDAELAQSRRSSASNSRAASHILTPQDRSLEGGYFGTPDDPSRLSHNQALCDDEWAEGPEFVNLDETLDSTGMGRINFQEDEATIQKLVRTGNSGVGSWFGGLVGWPLFSVDEREEASEDEDLDYCDETDVNQPTSRVRFQDPVESVEDHIAAPSSSDGAWKDTAWLLSVA